MSVAGLKGALASPTGDVIRHAMGAGFLLPVRVGMSLRMRPGFARLRVDCVGAAWVASGVAVTAGLFRVCPGQVSWAMVKCRDSSEGHG